MLPQAIFPNCFSWKFRGKLPSGFLFGEAKPFDKDFQLSIVIPPMGEKSFEHIFRALPELVSALKESLRFKCAGPFRIPQWGRWGTSDMVTAHCAESLGTLDKKTIPIGL